MGAILFGSTALALTCDYVGLLTHYSNRPDILHDLGKATQQLQAADRETVPAVQSVRAEGRKIPIWSLAARLDEAELRAIVADFEAGTPRWRLAEQHKISLSSVARVLRLHRTQQELR